MDGESPVFRGGCAVLGEQWGELCVCSARL